MSTVLAPFPSVPAVAKGAPPARRGPGADAGLAIALVLALAAAPPLLQAVGAPFWADVLTRVMILGIAATALNLLVGLAGLVSLGHAAYLGIGGYAVGISSLYGLENGFAHFAVAIGASALFALGSGLVALRTRGVHFIMLTMALSQMAYFVMIGLRQFGGDDGLTINSRSVFPIDIENRLVFYYVTLALLAGTLLVFARLRASRFGLVLAAAKGNERRVAAVGLNPFTYRLIVYVAAGVLAGIAGFLDANFASFVTPESMGWSRSGELIFMAVLGGVGTLAGPLVGVAAFVLLEEVLGSITIYWHFWFGLFLIAVVLFARAGLVGLLLGRRR